MININKTKKGLTIVELLVSISILIIGMAGFSLLFSSVWKNNSLIFKSGQATTLATRTIELISKDLRKAKQADNGDYPIKSGDSFDLVFYANVDSDNETERVHYFLDSDKNIKRGISDPNSDSPPVYPNEDENIIIIASNIVNSFSAPEPIFFYYGKNYLSSEDPLGVPVSVTEPRLIRVNLLVNVDNVSSSENVKMESFIEIRNLNENLY